jgi:hypothetical protein
MGNPPSNHNFTSGIAILVSTYAAMANFMMLAKIMRDGHGSAAR